MSYLKNILLMVMVCYAGTCTASLSVQEIIDSYHAGAKAGATHMLVVWDTWDYEGSYNFVVYNYPGEDVNALINSYDAPGFYRISKVFALHLDITEQLQEFGSVLPQQDSDQKDY